LRPCATSEQIANKTRVQLIFSVFKTLTDQTVTVELKNDLSITGVLKSVDQYAFSSKYPYLLAPHSIHDPGF
jgi:hypothetical protein